MYKRVTSGAGKTKIPVYDAHEDYEALTHDGDNLGNTHKFPPDSDTILGVERTPCKWRR